MNGERVIDLAEVRAARGLFAVAEPVRRGDVFRHFERQALAVGTAAELMVSGMTRFIDELDGLMDEVQMAREFCAACQGACELDDIDAMIAARDRLRADYDERFTSMPSAAE